MSFAKTRERRKTAQFRNWQGYELERFWTHLVTDQEAAQGRVEVKGEDVSGVNLHRVQFLLSRGGRDQTAGDYAMEGRRGRHAFTFRRGVRAGEELVMWVVTENRRLKTDI